MTKANDTARRIWVLFPVKLWLENVRGDCAHSQTPLAATRG